MRVKATEDCFFRNVRRFAGETFEFNGTKKELPEWVEPAEDKAPAPKRKSSKASDAPEGFEGIEE